ncbi:MAG: hypothetical protein R2849_12815 [Thermomicrobiales bacterium]
MAARCMARRSIAYLSVSGTISGPPDPDGGWRKPQLDFFAATFDLDIIKIMPDIEYPFPRRSIRDLDGWRLIEPIDVDRSRFFNQRAVAIQALRDAVGYGTQSS